MPDHRLLQNGCSTYQQIATPLSCSLLPFCFSLVYCVVVGRRVRGQIRGAMSTSTLPPTIPGLDWTSMDDQRRPPRLLDFSLAILFPIFLHSCRYVSFRLSAPLSKFHLLLGPHCVTAAFHRLQRVRIGHSQADAPTLLPLSLRP